MYVSKALCSSYSFFSFEMSVQTDEGERGTCIPAGYNVSAGPSSWVKHKHVTIFFKALRAAPFL